MFNASTIFLFYALSIFRQNHLAVTLVYVFNDDSGMIENLHGLSWDRSLPQTLKNPKIKIMTQQRFYDGDDSLIPLWMTAAKVAGIDIEKMEFIQPATNLEFTTKMIFNSGDVFLQSKSAGLMTFQLLPFMFFDYAIYYKIKDFQLSSTFFIDGLSSQLWAFVGLGFLMIFLGFSISAFLFYRLFRHRSSIGFLFIYQANFWCLQSGAETKLDRYLSWKVQKWIAYFFNCIVMTAFTAKFIELMSVRHYTQPFHSLEDISRIRSHNLCIEENLYTLDYFTEKEIDAKRRREFYRPEWIGLLNEPVCDEVKKNYFKSLCDIDNLAFVMTTHQFEQRKLTCDSFELKNLFRKAQITITISNIYSYKKKLNVAFLLMRTTGVIDRVLTKYNINKNEKLHFRESYKDKYEVWKHGVTFDHVKLIFIAYFSIFPFVFVILVFEMLYKRWSSV